MAETSSAFKFPSGLASHYKEKERVREREGNLPLKKERKRCVCVCVSMNTLSRIIENFKPVT